MTMAVWKKAMGLTVSSEMALANLIAWNECEFALMIAQTL